MLCLCVLWSKVVLNLPFHLQFYTAGLKLADPLITLVILSAPHAQVFDGCFTSSFTGLVAG